MNKMKKRILLPAFAVLIAVSLLFRFANEGARYHSEVISIESSQVVLSDQPLVSKMSIQKADTIQRIVDSSDQSLIQTHGSLLTMPEGAEKLNQTEQESLWNAFSKARRTVYPLTDRQRELPANAGAHFFAQNPRQQVVARFMEDGVQFGSGYAGRDWTGKLSLADSQPLEIRHEGTVLEYHYDGIVEWIENRPEGYRQGWVLSDRPIGGSHEHIRLALSLVGLEVQPLASREKGASDLQFVNAAGEPVLSYTGLMAWDANGQALESFMQPTEEGLEIFVADAGAVYPIVIDPLVASLESKLGPEVTGDGGQNDEFGLAVSIAGDTALIGASDDDDNGLSSGAAYVFVRSGGSWNFEQKLIASDGLAYDRFGVSLGVYEDTAIIGADRNDGNGSNSGSAYVFVRSGSNWSEQEKLTASDGAAGDEFGFSVSIYGNTALVGVRGDDSGSAYVFVRNGNNWSQQQKLTASDGAVGDRFGYAVSLSSDTALIGAYQDNHEGTDSGSAYVFVRDGTNWSEQQKLNSSDATASDLFGYAVSLSGDTALVGAYQDDDDGDDSGSAYVFVRDGSSWSEQQKLTASDGAAGDRFGSSVSIFGDTILVGAPRDDDIGSSSGSTYVYVRSGTTWSEQQKLSAEDNAAGDRFGDSVCVSEDTALIGAPRDDDGHSNSGSAYILVREGSRWSQEQKLTLGDNAEGDRFGFSVSVDGNMALIGVQADNDNGSDSGSAYIFSRTGEGWSQEQKVTPDDGDAGDRFGTAVSISGDIALVGVFLDDIGDIEDAGSAYVFVRTGGSWTQEQKLTGDVAGNDDYFGYSVSVSGDTALIGAYYEDDKGINSGSVYVFLRDGTSWSQEQKLSASDADIGDRFGYAVSVDDDIALISAPGDDDLGSWSGSVYVFVRSGTSWSQEQKLTASDGVTNDEFGDAVSVSGGTALIGAYKDDDNGTASGSAYVFVRDGTVWSQQQKLIASDGEPVDYFGRAVSISANIAVVGAYLDDEASENSGSAYVFMREGTTWTQQSKLTPANGSTDDFYGYSVSVSGDTALVGVDWADGLSSSGSAVENQGAVYVYRLIEDFDQGSDTWQLANGFDPNVPNDEATLDSDGDGDLDFLEIFQGTNRNDASERFGFKNAGYDGSSLVVTFRRSTTQTSINFNAQWSRDLINWYSTGQTDGNITVDLSETVAESGTGFQLIELEAEVTEGATNKLFLHLLLSPDE